MAAHVDHAAGTGGQHGFDDSGFHTLAGRVEHDHVRAKAVRDEAGQQSLHGGDVKFGVGDSVARGVAARALHGLRHDFDADHARGAAREAQRQRARARVGVHGHVAGGEGGKVHRCLIEPLGLVGVDLKEGERRHFKGQAQQRFKDGVLAVEPVAFAAQDDVVFLGVYAYV